MYAIFKALEVAFFDAEQTNANAYQFGVSRASKNMKNVIFFLQQVVSAISKKLSFPADRDPGLYQRIYSACQRGMKSLSDDSFMKYALAAPIETKGASMGMQSSAVSSPTVIMRQSEQDWFYMVLSWYVQTQALKKYPECKCTKDTDIEGIKKCAKALFAYAKDKLKMAYFPLAHDFIVQLLRDAYRMASFRGMKSDLEGMNECDELLQQIGESDPKITTIYDGDFFKKVADDLLPALANKVDFDKDAFLVRLCMTMRDIIVNFKESIVTFARGDRSQRTFKLNNTSYDLRQALSAWCDDQTLLEKASVELKQIDQLRLEALRLLALNGQKVNVQTVLEKLDGIYQAYVTYVASIGDGVKQNKAMMQIDENLTFWAAACADVWATLAYRVYGGVYLGAFDLYGKLKLSIDQYTKSHEQSFFTQAVVAAYAHGASKFALWDEGSSYLDTSWRLRYTTVQVSETLQAYFKEQKAKESKVE